MSIGTIGSKMGGLHETVLARAESVLAPKQAPDGFADKISDAIQQVASAQNEAAGLARAYELGLENDLSKVMISQQVSSLGFQMTLNVRNKVLSAYKDVMNMPV